MREHPTAALPISAAKCLVVGLAATAWACADGGGSISADHMGAVAASSTAVAAILWTGLVTTAGALALESEAFKFVPATDVAIILSSEPLIAAGFA